MHAAPARYVSVTELYSADEVALLLDEIRELEPTSCQGEDVQDFEIAGSGAGAGAGWGGGRSPCGTEATERSWDSHAHYTRPPPPSPRALAPLYCDARHLLTARGLVAALLALCGLAACACVWAVCGARPGRLPLAPRVRALLLAALSTALVHGALVLVHVTRLAALLPLPWGRLALAACAWSGGALACGGGLLLHAVLAAPEYRWAPPGAARALLAGAGLGLAGALLALAGACGEAWCWWGARRAAAPPGAYRAVPTAPPAAPQPSTSREHPL